MRNAPKRNGNRGVADTPNSTTSTTGITTDDQFWNSSPKLKYIRDYAHARGVRVAPWALLFTVLTRICAAVPPNVVLPALAGGSPMSLNFYIGLLGASGDGKGNTERAARNLIPDMRNALVTQPASGEGLAAIYAKRTTDEEKNSILTCVTPRALLDIPEIATLGATAKRIGSTVIPTLTSSWSGEELGAHNKNEDNRLNVPEYGYRMAMVIGIQPANLRIVLEQADTGLPQRLIWASVLDPDTPEHGQPIPDSMALFDPGQLPEEPSQYAYDTLYQSGSRWEMLNHGESTYPLTCIKVPDAIRASSDADSTIRLRGKRANPLDGHMMGVQLKLAALLAILEHADRLEVDALDWERAQYAYAKSSRFRADAIRQAQASKRDQRAASIQLEDEAREQAEQRKLGQAETRIKNYLHAHDTMGEGIAGYVIQKSMGRLYKFTYDALQSLYAQGIIQPTSIEDYKSGTWTLTEDAVW